MLFRSGSTWYSNSGLLEVVQPKKLLLPTARQFDGIRITKSAYQPDSANNAVNALVAGGFLKGGISINPFIVNPYSWFILTNYEHGFKYFLREALEIDFMSDYKTYNTTCSALERYVFGYSNFRGVFGSPGI